MGVGMATIIFPILYQVSKSSFIEFRHYNAPFYGLLLSFIVYWIIGGYGIAKNYLWAVQIAPIIGMIIVYIAVLIGKVESKQIKSDIVQK